MNKNMKAIWCPDNTYYFKDVKYGIEELGVMTFYGEAAQLDNDLQQALADQILELIQFFVTYNVGIAAAITTNMDLVKVIDLIKIREEIKQKKELKDSLF